MTKINAIRGVLWNPNDFAKTYGMGTAPRYGVIAEEVQAQFPELVFQLPDIMVAEGEEPYLGVDYSKLSAILIEAIKDLDNKLTNIEGQLPS